MIAPRDRVPIRSGRAITTPRRQRGAAWRARSRARAEHKNQAAAAAGPHYRFGHSRSIAHTPAKRPSSKPARCAPPLTATQPHPTSASFSGPAPAHAVASRSGAALRRPGRRDATAMAHRLLQESNSEEASFPIVCETCLGPNPYVRMQKVRVAQRRAARRRAAPPTRRQRARGARVHPPGLRAAALLDSGAAGVPIVRRPLCSRAQRLRLSAHTGPLPPPPRA